MTDATLSLQAQNALTAGRVSPSLYGGMDMTRARQAAEDFEAFFLSQMVQPMFSELDAEEPFGGGQAEKMWRSLQVDELGKAFAKNGGVGIADMVFREMIKMQEVQ